VRNNSQHQWWAGFTLQEAIFIGFSASMIVLSRILFRLHLGISGHSMFMTVFFLLLGKGCVPKRWSASTIGIFAGILGMILGLGKGGPLALLKLLLPGVGIDLMSLVVADVTGSYLLCLIAGLIATASRMPGLLGLDLLAGMDTTVAVQHSALETLGGMLFGSAGALLAHPLIKRLKRFQILDH